MDHDTTRDRPTDDRTYETPTLTVLGTAAELTSEFDASEPAK